MGDDAALTRPTISEATIAPGTDPIVPNTITANEGRSKENAVVGW